MKTTIAILFACAAIHAADTNVFETLVIGEKVYKNARIVSVNGGTATVLFDGGGKKISLAEFPPDVQKRYDYDPGLAKAQDEFSANKKAEADRLRAVANAQRFAAESTVEPPIELSISDAISSFGYTKCTTSAGTILIKSLPGNIAAHFAELKRLTEFAKTESNRIAKQMAIADRAQSDSIALIGAVDDRSQASFAMKANKMKADARIESQKLDDIQERIFQLEKSSGMIGQIMASKTAQKYSNMEVWVYTGKPVPRRRGE